MIVSPFICGRPELRIWYHENYDSSPTVSLHYTAPCSRLTPQHRGERGREGEGGRGARVARESYLTDWVFFLVFYLCPSILEVGNVQSECIAFVSAHSCSAFFFNSPPQSTSSYLLYLSPQSIWFSSLDSSCGD